MYTVVWNAFFVVNTARNFTGYHLPSTAGIQMVQHILTIVDTAHVGKRLTVSSLLKQLEKDGTARSTTTRRSHPGRRRGLQ